MLSVMLSFTFSAWPWSSWRTCEKPNLAAIPGVMTGGNASACLSTTASISTGPGMANASLMPCSTSFGSSMRTEPMPIAFATSAKFGVHSVVPNGTRPASWNSMSTKSSIELWKTTSFTGSWRSAIVMRSPNSIEMPPSPHIAITWRPG